MQRIDTIVRGVASWAARICGLLVLLMAILISVDVTIRKLFDTSLLAGGVGELSGYSLAIISFWGASAALLNRAHVRIDTLTMLLPKGIGTALDFLALISFAMASIMLSWMGWAVFQRSFELGSHSMTPLAVLLAIPQGIWVAALFFLTLVSFWLILYAATLAATGRQGKLQKLIGAKSADEELEEQNIIISGEKTA